MAADVSTLVRILRGNKEEGEGKRDLITRDLLGGGGSVLGSAGVVDLDFQAPAGWDRRLDLLSGRTYLQKSGSGPLHRQLQDLNLPPPPSSAAMPEDPAALDLKLVAPYPPSGVASGNYRSVCTLEKVKLALERAERESRFKHPRPDRSSPSPSSSTTSSSFKRRSGGGGEEGEEGADGPDFSGGGEGGMMAAGCPRCLFYVLISKRDPRCPRCDCHVPVPAFKKRPRIDLNSADN